VPESWWSLPVVVRGSVREQVGVAGRAALVALVPLVGGDLRQHVAENFVQAPAHPIGDCVIHAAILHRCHDGGMGLREKAKELADAALQKAGEYSEKAAEFSDVAREKAPGYVDRAADMAAKAVDVAATNVDKATGGRFHDKIEVATAKVEQTLEWSRSPDGMRPPGTGDATPTAPATGGPTSTASPGPTSAATSASDERPGERITPAATNPDATEPDPPKPDRRTHDERP
jgi:hypothetical protein